MVRLICMRCDIYHDNCTHTHVYYMYEVWHRRLDNWDLENAGWVIIIYNWVITLDSAFGTPFGILINSILHWWNNVADGFVRWVKLVMPEAKIIKWRHSSKGIKRVIQAKTLRHSDTASWHWLCNLHAAENSKTFKWRHSSKATKDIQVSKGMHEDIQVKIPKQSYSSKDIRVSKVIQAIEDIQAKLFRQRQ